MSDIKTDAFMHETRGVTRTLGRKHSMDVVFQGEEAKTDGTTIYMPSLPVNVDLKSEQARGFRGFADHETFHIRHTDTDFWKKKFGNATIDPELLTLTNALEDIRVERQGIREYPGTQKNIAATVELLDKHTRAKMEEAKKKDPAKFAARLNDPKKMLSLAISMEGRRRMDTAVETTEAFVKELGPDVMAYTDKALELLDKSRYGKAGTEDAAAIAQALLDAVRNGKPPSEVKPMPGDGKAESGPEGEAEAGLAYDGDKTGEEMGGGHGATGFSFETLESAKANIKRAQEMESSELGTAVSNEAKVVVKNGGEGNMYRVLTTKYDKWHRASDKEDKFFGSEVKSVSFGYQIQSERAYYEARYNESVSKTRASIGVMRRKLERMVLAQQRRDWNGAQEYGQLDPRRLASVPTGQQHVFRVRTDRAEMDTAVAILVDLSGSMHGDKALIAQQVAISLARCLETIGSTYGIFGFNNRTGPFGTVAERNAYHKEASREHVWGRVEPLDIYVFKDFDQRLKEAHHSMGAISSMVGGNNSDGDALLEIWRELKRQPAKRHILITLSDGHPAASTDVYIDGEYAQSWRLKDAISTITSEGGECFGVGILSGAVQEFYPEWAVARSITEFAEKTMDVMTRILLNDVRSRRRLKRAMKKAA